MSTIEVNGKTIELDENGNMVDPTQWDEDVARALAEMDDKFVGELTEEHFDVLNWLREQYFEHNEQPMERVINKGISKLWGKKLSSKDLYKLFPLAPSKQGNHIAGLPYVARKGGY